jgi:hypothetical protein
MFLSDGEHPPGLLGDERAHLVSIGHPELDQPGDVAREHVLVHRVVQGCSQHAQQMPDGAFREEVLAALRLLLRAAPRLAVSCRCGAVGVLGLRSTGAPSGAR